MKVYIVAPTIRDAKHIERLWFDLLVDTVGITEEPARARYITPTRPDALRGMRFDRGDLIIWDLHHLRRYATPDFWEDWSLTLRGRWLPAIMDIGSATGWSERP